MKKPQESHVVKGDVGKHQADRKEKKEATKTEKTERSKQTELLGSKGKGAPTMEQRAPQDPTGDRAEKLSEHRHYPVFGTGVRLPILEKTVESIRKWTFFGIVLLTLFVGYIYPWLRSRTLEEKYPSSLYTKILIFALLLVYLCNLYVFACIAVRAAFYNSISSYRCDHYAGFLDSITLVTGAYVVVLSAVFFIVSEDFGYEEPSWSTTKTVFCIIIIGTLAVILLNLYIGLKLLQIWNLIDFNLSVISSQIQKILEKHGGICSECEQPLFEARLEALKLTTRKVFTHDNVSALFAMMRENKTVVFDPGQEIEIMLQPHNRVEAIEIIH